ncbi:MAG: sulfite exporter TauE/SafE family protein [Verrucomicrobiales bacterium]|nr:sulfite exporter TauE/SafE family protein [Verrucomicrobiales bacterium]
MGYGTIITPTLILLGYEPSDIVPTVLLSELLSGFTAAFFHHEIRNVDFRLSGRDLKPAALLAGGSVVGATVGVMLALNLPKDTLRQVIGCIILLSGFFVVVLARRVVVYRNWKMLALSGVASFNKAVSGGGYGPLVTSGQILTGVPGRSAVGITSFAEAFTCLLASALFLIKGGYVNLTLFIPMCAGALCSVPFSVFAINKANEDHLKIIIGVLTMVIGAATLRSALQ